MSMDHNPGVRQDEEAAVWASIIDDVRDDPAEGLPELARILRGELVDAGVPLDDPVALADAQPDIVADWRELESVVAALDVGRDVDHARLRHAVGLAESLHRATGPEADKPADARLEPIEAAAEEAIEVDEAVADYGEVERDD